MEYTFGGYANYTTEAWVDSRETVTESDETNNTNQLPISVRVGLPDLVISAVTFDPAPPVQGQSTTVEVSVHNRGSKPAGGFDVEWWASVSAPAPACEWNVTGGLVPEGTVTLDCTHVYPSWYSRITTRATADVNEDVAELDEGNNALDEVTSVNEP